MSKQLIFPNDFTGFTINTDKPRSPTVLSESEPPPPAISIKTTQKVKKEPELPPPPPPPDPAILRAKILKEEGPRIQQETEIRVREEERVAHQKKLTEETDRVKATFRQAMAEEVGKRNAIIQSLEQQCEQFAHDMKAEIAEQVIDRSMEIASMILQHSLPDPTMIRRLIKETLAPISDLQGARVRISPSDLTMLKNDTTTAIDHDGQFEWVPDNTLSRGDLIIESRNGIFDASLEQRLTLLEEQLRKRIRNKHGTNSST